MYGGIIWWRNYRGQVGGGICQTYLGRHHAVWYMCVATDCSPPVGAPTGVWHGEGSRIWVRGWKCGWPFTHLLVPSWGQLYTALPSWCKLYFAKLCVYLSCASLPIPISLALPMPTSLALPTYLALRLLTYLPLPIPTSLALPISTFLPLPMPT